MNLNSPPTLSVQDFCPCTALVNFLETPCYSGKSPGNFTSLETVLPTKSFLGICLVHCTFPNSAQLGNLTLFGCATFLPPQTISTHALFRTRLQTRLKVDILDHTLMHYIVHCMPFMQIQTVKTLHSVRSYFQATTATMVM